MTLSKRQVTKLHKIIDMAEQLLATANEPLPEGRSASRSASIRRRRSGAEAEKMRADVLAKRAKGVPAATLAEKYGVSTAYIYMIK